MSKEKLVPKLRFSGFDDEWGEVKLGEIFDIKNGLNKGKEFFGKGIQILNYMDVNKHEFNTEKMIEGLVELTEDEIERFSVKPNDLFFTRTSETSDEIGLTSAYIGNEVNCVFSGFILRARPKIGLNSLFYAYYFRSPQQRNNIIKYSSITTRALISGANLSKMKIRLPQAEEQNNIAKFLQIIDKKIELLEKKHQYYQDFKKYLMQQIFAQKLRFDFHDDWEIKKLGEITQINTGKKDVKDKKDDGKYPFFVRSEKIERIDSYSFDGEAILIPGDGKIGEVYHYINGKFDYHQRVYKISDFHNDVFGKYIYYYLEKNFLRQAMKNTAKATVDSLRMDTLTKMPIELPSFEEQIKIANSLTFTDEKINLAKNDIDVVNKFKKALLQQMFV